MRKIAAPILYRSLSKILSGNKLVTACSLILLLGLSACVIAPPAPYEEYVLARAAVRAAQEVDSARFSTGLWNRAEESYRNGAKTFKDADFKDAQSHFLRAIEYAERAENATRLKKFQSGDSFP